MPKPSWTYKGRLTDFCLKEMQDKPGVYKLYLPRLRIGRLHDEDRGGLLYIGSSDKLSSRLTKLRTALLQTNAEKLRKEPGHVAAARYRAKRRLNENLIPIGRLRFKAARTATKDEAKDFEDELLWAYFQKFGEVPPFNATLKLFPKGTLRE